MLFGWNLLELHVASNQLITWVVFFNSNSVIFPSSFWGEDMRLKLTKRRKLQGQWAFDMTPFMWHAHSYNGGRRNKKKKRSNILTIHHLWQPVILLPITLLLLHNINHCGRTLCISCALSIIECLQVIIHHYLFSSVLACFTVQFLCENCLLCIVSATQKWAWTHIHHTLVMIIMTSVRLK